MVRIHPDPPVRGVTEVGHHGARRPPRPTRGAVAQLGERLLCKQEAVGSIPSGSTSSISSSSTYRLRDTTFSTVQCRSRVAGARAVRSVERCSLLFNNSEGKGSLDLMRIRRAKG